MVSFSCEACGDVITKKKLDSHRNQCRGASFTCLDCQTHFRGTEYRSHTSCISEAQKYEGRYYKEKAAKRKSVTIAEPGASTSSALVPRPAYVEDVPEDDAPPHAPTPPPAAPEKPLNVFDYLVAEDTPNASRVSLGGSKEQMSMVDHAPSVFETSKSLAHVTREHDEESAYDVAFEENGFSYGAEPIRKKVYADDYVNISQELMTPAPKGGRGDKENSWPREWFAHSRTDSQNTASSDKKRKRGGHVEELNVAAANNTRFDFQSDTPMATAPPSSHTPGLAHSGLTGGLNRLTTSEFPPSPDYSGGDDHDHHRDPASPLKRSRRETTRSTDDSGLGISIKGRAGRLISLLGTSGVVGGMGVTTHGHGNGNNEKALVRTRRRSSSENDGASQRQLVQQKRPRKHHRVHGRHTGTHSSQYVSSSQQARHRARRHGSHHNQEDNSPDGRPARRLKAIEYKSRTPHAPGSVSDSDVPIRANGHKPQKSASNPNQLVVYQPRPEMFLSLVTKGPESERGCSINKVLKRYHRELHIGGREEKVEEEKELWKSLRLKKNDRGEVVVFAD